MTDRLLIFNLDYFRYQMFDYMARNGGNFLPRLSKKANPLIVTVHRHWRGRSIKLKGKRRECGGRRRPVHRRLRLVGVRHAKSGAYRFYLTNLAPEMLNALAVAQLYACPRHAEFVFRQMKSHYRLDELPSRKAAVVEALMLASVLTVVASAKLLKMARRRLGEQARRIRKERRAALLATVGTSMLEVMLLPSRVAGALARGLESMLLHKALDPNRKRTWLLERVDIEAAAWSR